MEKLLLSIKPVFLEKIFSGDKMYEYRKFKCREDVERIVFYASSPKQRVVGEAAIDEIIEGSPEEVWEKTSSFSGIDKGYFDEYYKGKDKAFAYKLCDIREYSSPKKLQEIGISSAPQSYRYILQK